MCHFRPQWIQIQHRILNYTPWISIQLWRCERGATKGEEDKIAKSSLFEMIVNFINSIFYLFLNVRDITDRENRVYELKMQILLKKMT